MALFGGARDISLFRHVNRELMADVITQQCSFYKFKLEETKVNIYGEAAEEKFYNGPFLFNVLINSTNSLFLIFSDSLIPIGFDTPFKYSI